MDPVIEYIFGTGSGAPTGWASPADADPDADGHNEAVTLDFDGDGRRDDLLWDLDGDGVADLACLDLDDDDAPDHFCRDDGSGVWAVATDPPGSPSPRSGAPPAAQVPDPQVPDPAPPAGGQLVQTDDLDDDGIPDVEAIGAGTRARRLYLDVDGDGAFDRVLVDLDGDGTADAGYPAGAPGFDR
ncbi:MAG: hypothetical protein QM662_12500 [Gordonia sp. (in: high G+C Gram-positive bacteria)]